MKYNGTAFEIIGICMRSVFRQKLSFSEVSVIAYNLIPVAGVIFAHWSVKQIIFMYWFECLFVSIYSLRKLQLPVDKETFIRSAFIYGLLLLADMSSFIGIHTDDNINVPFSRNDFLLNKALPFLLSMGFVLIHLEKEFKKFIPQPKKEKTNFIPEQLDWEPAKKLGLLLLTQIIYAFVSPFLPYQFGFIPLVVFFVFVKYTYEHVVHDQQALSELKEYWK